MKVLPLFASFIVYSSVSSAMTLNEFLEKVGVQNNNVQAQKLSEESSALRSNEGYLLTSPNLFALGSYTSDKKESQNPSFEGFERNSNQYQLGIEQQTSLGINHKLYYSMDRSDLIGVDPAYIPDPTVNRSSFNYEFTVPIWRNGLGRSTKDQVDSLVEQNKSDSLTAKFNQKQLKANAIAVYWRLKSAQELYSLSNELLESNKKFLAWTKGRVRDRLSEDTDLKQAEAALALREYELEQTQGELLEAQQAFNEMLEVAPNSPTPPLDSLPPAESLSKNRNIMDVLKREDLESLQSMLNAQNAQSRIVAEGTRPQLDFIGMVSSNGLDPKAQESFNKSLKTDHPAYTVGIKFSVPLDRGSVNDVQKSAKVRSAGIESQIRRKQFEVKAELEKLQRNYNQAVKVFEKAQAVERAQFAKYKQEAERRRIGRTTTFQLLSFQQEYQQAKQSLIRAQSAILQLNAQFVLFSDKNGESL